MCGRHGVTRNMPTCASVSIHILYGLCCLCYFCSVKLNINQFGHICYNIWPEIQIYLLVNASVVDFKFL